MHHKLEYATSGHSKCKDCRHGRSGEEATKIPKGSLRVGSGCTTAKGIDVFSWQHWGCTKSDVLLTMKKGLENGQNPHGLDRLTAEDRHKVMKVIGKIGRLPNIDDESDESDESDITKASLEARKKPEVDTDDDSGDDENMSEQVPANDQNPPSGSSLRKRKCEPTPLSPRTVRVRVRQNGTKDETHEPTSRAQASYKSSDLPRQRVKLPPRMALRDFCREYSISSEVFERLQALKIDGPHVLQFIKDEALNEHLSIGEVASLRYAEELWKEDIRAV